MATKGRTCSRSCLDYLLIEVVSHYANARQGPCLEVALEAIGLRVGIALAEWCTRDRSPISEPLDIIKFICKELWTEAFGKGVDNLRTNHRGTFVLRDVQFSWLEALHPNQLPPWLPGAGPSRTPTQDDVPPSPTSPGHPAPSTLPSPVTSHAVLPCALLRGALSALGLEASVTLDASSLPQADFTVVLRSPPGSWAGQE
ncbi:Trafficking protein particle complex subunit 6B [Auxenochlorella protothecoides]|uniref:Trafficking protein particle complex subunit 6B n=1 Tax=Auxenochlorella protothecoides TaxID=3075 RepID=A0A087SQR5_AUXPR|nr:Trafficking protein particle complex subunit 6B [Auxenochlorella protothecoides]KFM28069.1 Trafficking protein particle complex subunit 6B [Auxenochlorella protothecoides]RMZ54034.1 hypothetical protein APUTEX25_002611 [Auxenochlorella protothecoides]|eukprot:RMZ54034.1 hypothetical protein APUTEX25_002611 [Auxenochlorella protothecoides]